MTLAAWAIAQATSGASRNFTRSRYRAGNLVGATFQLVETGLRLGEDPDRPLMGCNQLLERRCAARELGDGLLETCEELLEPNGLDGTGAAGLVQFASGAVTAPGAVVATTRPRMPFTKRPDSSPEKVLASSIDSLMAAFVGTWRSIAIS